MLWKCKGAHCEINVFAGLMVGLRGLIIGPGGFLIRHKRGSDATGREANRSATRGAKGGDTAWLRAAGWK
jgi:hypothetical protein